MGRSSWLWRCVCRGDNPVSLRLSGRVDPTALVCMRILTVGCVYETTVKKVLVRSKLRRSCSKPLVGLKTGR